MRTVLLALCLAFATTLVAQEKKVTASDGWVKTPAAGETQTAAFVSIDNPGMYEVNVTAMSRRSAASR